MIMSSMDVQIIPFYAQPHVHKQINDHTFYDETIAPRRNPDRMPYSTAVVMGADQGIDNRFVQLIRRPVKEAIFGPANFKKYGQPSLQLDCLFNGDTAINTMRVLPDNATFANYIIVAHFRRNPILDEFSQETGKHRMEIMFKAEHAAVPNMSEGAFSVQCIRDYADTHFSLTPDPITGYMSVPLMYTHSIGRGRYGSQYSQIITRNIEMEREYNMKMYSFTLVSNTDRVRAINRFMGSLYQTTRYEASTLISDVLDQWARGSVPVDIYSFEENLEILYDFYQTQVVEGNRAFIEASGSDEDLADLDFASRMLQEQFDPLFGLRLNTRSNELIPFYRNYTAIDGQVWTPPNHTVPDDAAAQKPLNIAQWNTADVGMTVLVIADPLHEGRRMLYRVIEIDQDTGNIVYDEGRQVPIDADQYVGDNIAHSVGIRFRGGHDGDFQEISVNGVKRPPTACEMKVLLAREYVKAFRGEKDRRILSPARMEIDILFDANYNMTDQIAIDMDDGPRRIFGNSTMLTDEESNQLIALGGLGGLGIQFQDLNVKKAMYDLNEWRTRNGMTVNMAEGAGSLLHLDCNLVGLRSTNTVSRELIRFIDAFGEFTGRNTSIDLGYYEIFDPVSTKRIQVTTSYFLASELIPHLMRMGINKPFTYEHATLRAFTQSNARMSGNMIRDSFRPDIDLIDWDVKEELFKSRINYYISSDEGRKVERAVQNTRQRQASVLLEENNVRTLNRLVRLLEEACRAYLYEWNKPEARQGYTDAQMERFRPWIGDKVEDLRIYFTANTWEQKRKIMRCFVEVKFFDIVKRIILEINIHRPDHVTGGDN